MEISIHQSTRGFNVIFIHSSLDDAGLSAAEFRVYSHLSRRASGGMAWPSIRSIAEVCNLNKDTVTAAIRTLEERSFIVRKVNGCKSTQYWLTSPSKWVMSETEGQSEASETEGQTVRNEGTPLSENRERKDIHEGNPKKEVAVAPAKSEPSIKSKVLEIQLPKELDSEEFIAAWDRWTSDRRARRIKPYTFQGALGQLERMAKWGQERAIAAIDYSIMQQHQGIYEENKKATNGHSGTSSGRNAGTFNANGSTKFAGIEKLA